MRRAVALAAALATLVFVAQAGGAPRGQEIAVQFSAYGPSQLDVLPGQIVSWSNVSQRTHTVTSDTGIFDSGHLPPGKRFLFTFDRPGSYLYHCTIHPSITGEIDVRRVTLGPLPTAAVPLGDRVEFEGVAADPSKRIRIERRVNGSHFAPLALASAQKDGAWRVEVPVRATGDYRARVGADVSETRRLIVGIRTVRVRPLPRGVSVEVTPSDPYAMVLVEVYRRERFGWWPVARRRLDYVSAADVGIKGPARVRVVLVDRDGWTPIATSRPVTLAGPRKRG